MATGGSASRLKWLSDQEKSVLISNFEKRGWVKGSSEGKPMRGHATAALLWYHAKLLPDSLAVVGGEGGGGRLMLLQHSCT